MTFKRYPSTPGHYKVRSNDWGKPDDLVVLFEKLDGANASVTKEWAGSRNGIVSNEKNKDLRGWYQESLQYRDHPMLETHILYGEWLVPHKLTYQEEKTKKFYPFSLRSIEGDEEAPFEMLKAVVSDLGLEMPHIFYEGKLSEMPAMSEFVGKSVFGDEGEGVVFFNTETGVRIKQVSDKFRESKGLVKPARDLTQTDIWVLTHCTEARTEKTFFKLVDEGVLDEELLGDKTNFGKVLSLLVPAVLQDALDEEGDSLPEGFEIKQGTRKLGRTVPLFVRDVYEGKVNF